MKVAIVIAVEEYSDPGIGSVPHARHDAEEFSQALTLHGFDRTDQLLLINGQATKGVVESKLRQLAKRLRQDDTVYFYYAGYGFFQGGKYFITCHDTLESDWDGTSVALAPILDELRGSACDRLVLFLDCHGRGIQAAPGSAELDGLNEHDWKTFLDHDRHCTCFAACRSDEQSWPSNTLRHGIWAYHIIEAFRGDAPLALERAILTANSLQNYLSSAVPRTLRSSYTTPKEQTPWMAGAASGDFPLADLRDLLAAKREQATDDVNLVTEITFRTKSARRLTALAGWKKGYRIPDRYSDMAESFVVKCAADDLKEELQRVYEKLKHAFGFTRRELEVSQPDDGTGTITTPYFNYSVTVTLNPDTLDEVVWTRTVDSIQEPTQVASQAFAEVFDDTFNTLEFSLPIKVDIESFIDAIEAARLPDVQIEYDHAATYCQLRLRGVVGAVTLQPRSLSIVHTRSQPTQQLIKSFDAVRKLVQQHNMPLSFFPAR